ncbi:MAG: DUF3160 domain-containing protein [Planctomycetes bacterium]|jgi:hypothetical protein|nr:DUF3160 domain-containing protein [Planctomycetota bacterium]
MTLRIALTIACVALLLPPRIAPAAEPADDGSSFTIRPGFSHKEIYDVYEHLRKADRPQFVTTDLALHTAHLLFDYSLRAIEIERLYGLAETLTREMVRACAEGPPDDPFATEREGLLAYFCVAARCLDADFEVPERVRKRVEKDLAYIEAHEGFEISATLDNAEDFSQYVPRGHYTRNEAFQRYFKAMMWYGRRMFRVAELRPGCLPIGDHWSNAHRLAETRQMLLTTRLLYTRKIDGKAAIETWRKLYTPTVLFAGRTEDLNPMEVRALIDRVWGEMPSLDALGDEDRVLRFADLAEKTTNPKIDSSGAGREGFGFMAQRFTPDSYITQCLVTDATEPGKPQRAFGEGVPLHPLPYTGDREPRPFTWGSNPYLAPRERRFMPRGLDVMAIFGCDEAVRILTAAGDTAYDGYDEMLAFLRKDVGAMMRRRRDENLYYAWLHALQPMMTPIASEHVPACLRSRRWLRKQLATSLASYTELRHDTILYVKQSYTPAPRGMPPARKAPAYLEPQPEVFRRIAVMVAKMHKDLTALGVLPDGVTDNYVQFAALCGELATVADKEIAGKPLTAEDRALLRGAAGRFKATTRLPRKLAEKVLSGTDSKMALIADVHTDNNTGLCLEEGVGTPFLLTVRMPLDGKQTTLHGAVFSYYEFKQPIDDRLTDEAWQEMLAAPDTRPEPPDWMPLAE